MTQKSTYLDVDIKRNASTDPINPIDFGIRLKIIASRSNRDSTVWIENNFISIGQRQMHRRACI